MSDGTNDVPEASSRTEFGAYRIVRTLGRGGMAVVYLAEHDWLQRKVALKVLAPQLAEDERFRERFVRESRLAASLDHPNVVPIYEAGASGGDLFIAMRYVEGTDLRTMLAETGALEPERAVAICRQVAAALDAAHEQGLVHRDVKPGNVLVARTRGSEAGEHVYLSDFGLTKRATSESGITGTGQFVGTLSYAAPEQFYGGTADARTDVYSLGCVLFECLTGHPPFRADNDPGLMYAHLQEAPPVLTTERPDLPAAVDGVIAKAMAKERDERQPTAGALVDEAAQALRVGVPSGPDGSGERRSRVPWLVAIAAVAVALVAGILVTSLLQHDAPEPAKATGQTSEAAGPSPTVAPAFRTADRPVSSDEELRLLDAIPDPVNGDCSPLDRDEPVQGELAALVCTTPDVDVLYELFPTQDDMNAAFQQSANGRAAPDGECATDHLAVSDYSIGGEPAGRVLCYTIRAGPFRSAIGEPSRSHIEWTDENSSIYAHAVRDDQGDLSLYEWWRSSAGPVVSSGVGTVVPTKDTSAGLNIQRLRDGTYLLSTTPDEEGVGPNGGTDAIRLHQGTYEYEGDGDIFEIGSTYLQKPNSIVFAPTRCPGAPSSQALEPVVYEWSVRGDQVLWTKLEGGTCAGPQPRFRRPRPWTRAPEGEIAVERGDAIEVVTPGGSPVRSAAAPPTSPDAWPDWSPDGSKIVFAGADQGGFDLYVMNADGTELTRLTNTPGDETTPAWSPDGGSIAFGFDDGGGDHFHSGIAVVRPDGTGRTEVVGMDDRSVDSPTWSPDGRRIAYTVFTDGVPAPFVVDASGGEAVALLDGPGFAQTWTLDGEHIMIAAFDQLVTVRPDGTYDGVFVRYPPERGRLDLDWSPDGRWIIATSARLAGNTLYLIRGDGSEIFQIGTGTGPSWRPEHS